MPIQPQVPGSSSGAPMAFAALGPFKADRWIRAKIASVMSKVGLVHPEKKTRVWLVVFLRVWTMFESFPDIFWISSSQLTMFHIFFRLGWRETDSTTNQQWMTQTGWWFGTFFIFPYIGNNHPNWLIFFRGVQTTNQQKRGPSNGFVHQSFQSLGITGTVHHAQHRCRFFDHGGLKSTSK